MSSKRRGGQALYLAGLALVYSSELVERELFSGNSLVFREEYNGRRDGVT